MKRNGLKMMEVMAGAQAETVEKKNKRVVLKSTSATTFMRLKETKETSRSSRSSSSRSASRWRRNSTTASSTASRPWSTSSLFAPN